MKAEDLIKFLEQHPGKDVTIYHDGSLVPIHVSSNPTEYYRTEDGELRFGPVIVVT